MVVCDHRLSEGPRLAKTDGFPDHRIHDQLSDTFS